MLLGVFKRESLVVWRTCPAAYCQKTIMMRWCVTDWRRSAAASGLRTCRRGVGLRRPRMKRT